MKFVSRIRGARDVHPLTPEDFDKRYIAEAASAGLTWQEYFSGNDVVTVYYDSDMKSEVFPGTDAVLARLALFKEILAKLHPGHFFLLAQRHGRYVEVPKKEEDGPAKTLYK